ncbi:MAG: response regulator transcription factor [Deltaproteobacteria bacterium]
MLLVDDDVEMLQLVGKALTREGHRVATATTIGDARAQCVESTFDVLVLDVMLPDGSGLEFCASLRTEGVTTPILFLSARGSVSSRVDGLEAGGDDYLPKPFALRELGARVQALGRRGAALRPRVVRVGAVVLDFAGRRASREGVEIPLTGREWDVLDVLARRAGRPMSYDDLLESAWGESTEGGRASLEVIVARLRRKLGETADGATVIRTLRGFGYALSQVES